MTPFLIHSTPPAPLEAYQRCPPIRGTLKSGISQARRRLGEVPLRRLYEVLAQPIATRVSKGAWMRNWRLVSLDGSCLEVADTEANRSAFGVPGASRGASAFLQLRFTLTASGNCQL